MKRILCIFALVILLSFYLPLHFNHLEVNAPTGYPVHNLDTSLNYTSIQGAINAQETLNGHKILVDEGIYFEKLVVNKSIELTGKDKIGTILDGNSTGNVIKITANHANVTGFTIQHGNNGIYLKNEGNGVYLSFCNIQGNIVRNNTNGIHLTGSSSNNNVSYNIITNNGHGIVLSYSGRNTLLGNNITNNRYNFEVEGFAFSHLNNYVDTSNIVDGKPIYYLIGTVNAIFGAESNAGTVFLITCQNVTVKDLTLTNNGAGVYLWNTTNSEIKNVTVTRSRCGVYLGDSCNNSLSDNMVANCTYGISLDTGLLNCNNNTIIDNNLVSNSRGIYLDTSSYNIITDNIVTDNSKGIYLYTSSDNILSRNIVSLSGYGVELLGSGPGNIFSNNVVVLSGTDGIVFNGADNNTLSMNIISSNGQYGITLMADNNIIHGNTINNSGLSGIYMGWTSSNILSFNIFENNTRGIFFYSEGENNKIFHNNFKNNTAQIMGAGEQSNAWDNGCEGNYWSNYIGTDSNNDGIGDTDLRWEGVDNYPLMGMFSEFNATSEYRIKTICNSTISDFQFNGTAISFITSGEDGTDGFCRIHIPAALMNETIRVLVNGTEILYSSLSCSNSTYRYLYFSYDLSAKEIIIIPEYPSAIILSLLMIATSTVLIMHKRKEIGKAQKLPQ